MLTLYNKDVDTIEKNNIAISIHNVGKKYRITQTKEQHDTIRDKICHGFKSITKQIKSRKDNLFGNIDFWALKGVSCDIKKGEVVGIIGRNGAGKSTLLKILTRITMPTAGYATIVGRVGSLLEVGTGFHQELTGRENVFLSGAILGMSRSEIAKKFDDIVEFSGIKEFIDVPVKRYSSGMTVRLGFAVAAHLEPEILLIDEVLAVGDVSFQKKCLGKMGDVANSGRTVLFVSHNMGAIRKLCPTCILLEKGKMIMYDQTDKVIAAYLKESFENEGYIEFRKKKTGTRFLSISLNESNNRSTVLDVTQPIELNMQYIIAEPLNGVVVSFNVFNKYGSKVFISQNDKMILNAKGFAEPGNFTAKAIIPAHFLAPGLFTITIGIHIPKMQIFDVFDHVIGFTVVESGSKEHFWAGADIGTVLVDVQWSVDSHSI